MRVTINGQACDVPEGATLEDALRHVGVDPSARGIAVARAETGEELAVVRRADWAATRLVADDRVEVVTATQGG